MKLNFLVSEKGILDALTAGRAISAAQSLEFDPALLPQMQRDLLAKNAHVANDQLYLFASAYTYKNNPHNVRKVGGNSFEDVFAEIALVQAEAAEAAAKKAAEAAAKKAARLANNKTALQHLLAGETGVFMLLSDSFECKHYIQPGEVPKPTTGWSGTSFFEEKTEIDAYNDEIAARKKAIEHQQATEAAAKKAAIEAMRQWGLKWGSELLRARIQEDMNWREMARNEWAAAQFGPDFHEWGKWIDSLQKDDPSGWVIKDATIEQIDILRAARAQFPNAIEITLRRIKDEDYDGDITHYDVLNVVLTAPDGEKCDWLKVLSTK